MNKANLFLAPGGLTQRILHSVACALLLAVVMLPTYTSAASLTEGLRKYEAGNYAGAIEEWQPLADQGNPDALFNLGQLYRMGRGVTADAVLAVEYYRRASIAGHAGARGALATIYYFDHATRQKRGEAIALWRQAAAAGDAPSQYTLAILYFNGQDVPRDLMQAYAWALLSAESGMAEGQKAEQSIRANLSPNQIQQAQVLKGALLLSPRASQPTDMTAATGPEVEPEIVPEIGPASIPVSVQPEVRSVEELVEVEATPAAAPVSAPAPALAQAEEAVAVVESVQEIEEIPEALPADAWSVQLGFYRSRDNAVREWDRLASRVESLMPGVTSTIATVDAGPERGIFYRLMAGAFDGRADADYLCNSLKAEGVDCVVKQP